MAKAKTLVAPRQILTLEQANEWNSFLLGGKKATTTLLPIRTQTAAKEWEEHVIGLDKAKKKTTEPKKATTKTAKTPVPTKQKPIPPARIGGSIEAGKTMAWVAKKWVAKKWGPQEMASAGWDLAGFARTKMAAVGQTMGRRKK